MERKKAPALAALLLVLLSSFVMFPQPVTAPTWEKTSFDTDGDGNNDVDVRNTTGPPRQIHVDLNRNGVIDPKEPNHTLPDGGDWTYDQPGGNGTTLKVVVNDRSGRWNYTIKNLNGDNDTSDPGECVRKFETRYIVMGGTLDSWTQLGPFAVGRSPFMTRAPYFTPMIMEQNVASSDAWFYNATYGWIVNITILASGFVGVYHEWYDNVSEMYFNLRHYLPVDGYGWLFLNDSRGDVDCYTFNNATGVYWKSPSPMAGQLAATPGGLPDLGPDKIAGTGDDGFGDGALDSRGSSILILPSKLRCEWYNITGSRWQLLFDVDWPVVFTTGTAYDIVIDAGSALNGKNATEVGQPQEFLAGLDHQGEPGYYPVPYDHPKWNAYITYACVWSMINITTKDYGRLDVMVHITEKSVRKYYVPALGENLVIPDINCDETVDIFDVVICAATFGKQDEGFGYPNADPNFDARGDLMPEVGLVDIFDFVVIAANFGRKLTPGCIILP